MTTELLRQFAEYRRMQVDREWARHFEDAARARGDGVDQRLLRGREVLRRQFGQAGGLQTLGHRTSSDFLGARLEQRMARVIVVSSRDTAIGGLAIGGSWATQAAITGFAGAVER